MLQATRILNMIFPEVLEIHKWVKRKRSRLTDIVMKDLSASMKRLKKATGLADVGDSFRSQSRGSILRASCSGLVQ